jgi:hypothetical protein
MLGIMSEDWSQVYTSGFRMRLLHCIAIFNYLPWFCSTKVSNKKCNKMRKPSVDFINVFCEHFSYEFFAKAKT